MWYRRAQQEYKREVYQDQFLDIDRYASDEYTMSIALKQDVAGYSVGALVTASMVGVASYMEYWHYSPDEKEAATKTFHTIKDRMIEVRKKMEIERCPQALLRPMCRAAMQEIDLEHKEKYGVFHVNARMLTDTAPDWRETLYGNRYPAIGAIDTQGPVKFNSDESSQEIQLEGKSSRDRVYKLKRKL